MVANKHISKIIIAIMAVAVVLCFLAAAYADELSGLLGGKGVRMEYASKLFDTDSIISIDIQMDPAEWDRMQANVMSEEYFVCDVVINGKKLQSVAIRPKGNTSLSAIAMDPDSDRYSLKLEFDHFVDGQTCYGLDKLILNNNYADATNMKEAVIYDMFAYLGADASLYNYAEVSLNGEYRGVFLALEAVESSFMLRNFGTQDGELYKPDTMEIGGNNGGGNGGAAMPDMGNIDMSDVDLSQFAGKTPPSGGSPFGGEDGGNENGRPSFGGPSGGDGSFDPNDLPADFDPGDIPADFDPSSLPEGFDAGNIPEGGPSAGAPASDGDAENGDGADAAEGSGDGSGGRAARSGAGGGFSKGGGANLNYTDDDLDSYSTIWESEVTGTSKGDHRRVVTALKNISEGTDLETYLNVDNVLKYMAVHTFSVNMDSLSGSMAHNYYLYEYDGQLNIIPWDYNLSFGGMSMGGSGDATHMVNDAIDTPFSGTKFFDALLEDETYLAQYHAYLQQLTDAYVNGGRFDETYTRIRSQIDALVETDPTAFYDYDEYQTAAEMLYETVKLRAESISGQLAGTIPSTDAGQRQDASAFVDASGIDVTAMGQLNMGASFESRGSDAGEDTADGESGAGDTDGKPADTRTADTSDDGTQSAAPEEESAAEEETTETATQKAEPPAGGSGGSSGGGMPGSGGFDPNNMPDMGSFDPGNMPDMGSFDPGNMPDMGSFDPGNMPDMGGFGLFGSSGGDREDQPENEGANGAQDESGEKTPGGGRSFSGMPGSSGVLAKTQTLALYGVSLVIILAALFAAVKFKRRKTA